MENESLGWAVLFFIFLVVLLAASDLTTIICAGACAALALFCGIAAEIEGER